MAEQSICKEQVQKVADLARVELSDQEVEKFTKDLGGILDHFKEISALNIKDVAPINHLFIGENQLRKDDIEQNDAKIQKDIKSQFPQAKGDYLKVKAVL